MGVGGGQGEKDSTSVYNVTEFLSVALGKSGECFPSDGEVDV